MATSKKGLIASLWFAGAHALAMTSSAGAATDQSLEAPFVFVRERVLQERGTGLYWTQKDSGFAMDWYGARDHCARIGQGWKLPSASDLDRLAASFESSAQALFQIGTGAVWSDTSDGISNAIGVDLRTGAHQATYRAKRQRVLCVGGA